MDQERWGRWIAAGHSLTGIEPFMLIAVQGIGEMDCQLREVDHHDMENWSIRAGAHMTTVGFRSYLWLLSAYELIRSLDQRHREGRGEVSERMQQRVREFKWRLERYRVPLAKYETAHRYPNDPSMVAVIVTAEGKFGWAISEHIYVSREQLGEEMLVLLGDYAKATPTTPRVESEE